jgi:hypothetical protein
MTNTDNLAYFSRRHRHPFPDHRRCEALAHGDPRDWIDWKRGLHRCGASGTYLRDGHRVCHMHRDCEQIAYFDPLHPPQPVPMPPEPPMPRKYRAEMEHLELHIEAAERLNRMAHAALGASDWKRLARLADQLANEMEAIRAVEAPPIRQASELTPRTNDLWMSLEGFDHELAQVRRSRKRGRRP